MQVVKHPFNIDIGTNIAGQIDLDMTIVGQLDLLKKITVFRVFRPNEEKCPNPKRKNKIPNCPTYLQHLSLKLYKQIFLCLALKDQGHIVLLLSFCPFVRPSVCLHRLNMKTFSITPKLI